MTDSMRWYIAFIVLIGCLCIYTISSVLLPFLVAFILAYLCNPLVERLYSWCLPRALSVFIVFIFILFVVLFFFVLIIPVLHKQIILFIDNIPLIKAWLINNLIPWVKIHIAFNKDFDFNYFVNVIFNALPSSNTILSDLWNFTSKSGMAIIAVITNIILIPVLFFYFLIDWHKLILQLQNLLPQKNKSKLIIIVKQSGSALSAFLRGQLLVMLYLGIIYSVGLSIVGLKVAIFIGIIAGILSFVPYLGFITGILLALLFTTIQFYDWQHLFWVIVIFVGGQTLESFVLTPYLVGDRVGLHPAAVIFAVLVGGKLFGFVGVLLAVPAAAIVVVLLRHARVKYTSSIYYLKR